MTILNKGGRRGSLQKSCTSASLEAYPKRSDSIDEKTHIEMNEYPLPYLPPEREEVVMWVWNNIITRDKMRRKSVAGVPPVVHFETRPRYIM